MRRFLGNVLTFLVACVFTLIVAEVAVRLVGYEGAHERITSVFDTDFGSIHKDSWVFQIDTTFPNGDVRIGPDIVPLKKPVGKNRILFLGDSGTEGFGYSPEQSFPKQFAAILRDVGKPVEVLNAGVTGMSTIDEYELLAKKLVALHPDIVVLGVFMGNDINFNLGHQERRSVASRDVITWLRQHSALGHFLYLKLMVLNARYHLFRDSDDTSQFVPAEIALVDEYGFHMLSYFHGELALYRTPETELAQRGYRIMESVLAKFQELALQQGFKFYVVLLPTRSRVAGQVTMEHHGDWQALLAKDGLQLPPRFRDAMLPTRRVLEICARLKLSCTDPADRMHELGTRGFRPNDDHPSAEGHHLIAEELVKILPLD